MTAAPIWRQPLPSLDAPDWLKNLDALREARDAYTQMLHEGRKNWYESKQAQIPNQTLNTQALRTAKEALRYIGEALEAAALKGQSQVKLDLLRIYQTQGWKYATYDAEKGATGPVMDISMNVELHQSKIMAAKLIHNALSHSTYISCKTIRVPEEKEDCFLEELSIEVTLLPKEKPGS